MSETLKTGGEESAENTGNDGPWGEEYQKSVPPFNPEQKAKPQDDGRVELGTSVGQAEYLENYLSNEKTSWEQRLEDNRFDPEGVNQRLAEITYQEKLLGSVREEIANGGDLVEALTRKYDEAYRAWEQDMHAQGQNYKGGESWQEMHYADNLCKTLEEQLTKNPETAPYLSPSSVEKQSENDIRKASEIISKKQAQLNNLNRMGNSEIDDKGIAHIFNYDKNGNPVETTVDLNAIKEEIENAEIDLKEATAEKEVWGDLLRDDPSVFEHKTPLHKIAKKSDLKPDVIKYIDERTPQIERLLAEAKTLEKGTPEYQENEAMRKQLAKERSAARRILTKYFNENAQPAQGETHEKEQEARIDVASVMDQMDADRDKYEKSLEAVEKERQRRIEWEKTHYGYIEGEGRAPDSVLAAEEDASRIRNKIAQKEKDADLLYRIYKENGKSQTLSSVEAQAIITRMVQERDAKMAAIDEELGKVEKKSERWKRLKQERAEAYRSVPDDVAERILGLFK